jgi:hypothetical protein
VAGLKEGDVNRLRLPYTISLAPVGKPSQVAGNRPPGVGRLISLCEKLWEEGVLEVMRVRRDPEHPWR